MRAFLIFLALAVVWTWPAAWSGGLVGSRADAWSTAWTLDAAPRILWHGGIDPLTAWPAGGDYRRLDSWVFAAVGVLGAWLPAETLHAAVGVLGTTISAWAAHRLAISAGATEPWSWLAGIVYAFSGVNAMVLVEGYTYFLLDPWLPLTAAGGLGILRVAEPEVLSQIMQGGAASAQSLRSVSLAGWQLGMGWALSLLTSAYVGLAASVMVGAFLVVLGSRLVGRRAARLRTVGRALRPALFPVGLSVGVGLLIWGIPWMMAPSSSRIEGSPVAGSAYLMAWGWASEAMDTLGHPVTATLPGTALALTMLAPRLLPRNPHIFPLALTGLAGFVLALGPSFSLDPTGSPIPLPFRVFELLGIAHDIRFPARFLWLLGLGAGVCAALVATELTRRGARATRVILVTALVEAFLGTGLPGRLRTLNTEVPSAYMAARGPILDVYPESEMDGGVDIRTVALACWYQTGHQQAIAENCVATDARQHTRVAYVRELADALGSGREPELPAFAAIVLHADYFLPADRERLVTALTRRHGAPVESHDGGEHVLLFHTGAAP